MLDKMMEQFKDLAELQTFAEAQSRTITTQSRRIQELEARLASISQGAAPSVIDPSSEIKDEEIIAREQLRRLRDISAERLLTLEETKKTETFHKILESCVKKEEKDVIDLGNTSTEDLIAQLTGGKDE